jgi:opacity protein-like surface antigen
MNKAKILFIAVSLLLIPISGVCEPNGWTGNVSVFLGNKTLNEDDWNPVDDQTEIGFLLDFRPENWPVNIAIDYLDSSEYKIQYTPSRSIRIDGITREINIGIRKIFEISPTIHPYIGGGVAYIYGEFETSELFFSPFSITISLDNDAGTGIWVDGGVCWNFAKRWHAGVDLRYSKAEITLFGTDVEAGGFHAGLLAGFHW